MRFINHLITGGATLYIYIMEYEGILICVQYIGGILGSKSIGTFHGI